VRTYSFDDTTTERTKRNINKVIRNNREAMATKVKKKFASQPSIAAAFGSPTRNTWNSTLKTGENDIDHEIRSNDAGNLTLLNISKGTIGTWKERRSRDWQKWLKKYDGPTHGFNRDERKVPPGQVGYKTGRIILTRMITQNPVTRPSKLHEYHQLIKQVWDDRNTLSKGAQGQIL
jgi:hypothetical protein